MEALRKLPPPRRELRYRTPISATVQSEELMIECRRGRVAVIDTGTLLAEARRRCAATWTPCGRSGR